jgi:hypothetical protein
LNKDAVVLLVAWQISLDADWGTETYREVKANAISRVEAKVGFIAAVEGMRDFVERVGSVVCGLTRKADHRDPGKPRIAGTLGRQWKKKCRVSLRECAPDVSLQASFHFLLSADPTTMFTLCDLHASSTPGDSPLPPLEKRERVTSYRLTLLVQVHAQTSG